MIRRQIIEPTTPEWVEWSAKAEKATSLLIKRVAAGTILSNKDISAPLYKGPREVLWRAFHGLCAYCEVKFVLDQSGDVEHYRPKLGVRDENDEPVDHPGYYWSAYDWRNLLPSCERCNRISRTPDGRLIGKGERFPVKGTRARCRDECKGEMALLIHPVFDMPEQHLQFDSATGLLGWHTDRGEVTVTLLGLNREGLPEARKDQFRAVRALVSELFSALKNENLAEAQELSDKLLSHRSGEEPFSMAGREALEVDKKRLQLLFKLFGQTSGTEDLPAI